MQIYMARHGETDWNVERRIQGSTDIPLNENGILQAHSLSRYLERQLSEKDRTLSCIFTSPLKRAKETAEVVGKNLRLPVKVISGLEEMNFGVCEGKSWLEAKKEYPRELEEWEENKRFRRIPGGESYQDVLERFFSAYSLMKKKLAEEKLDVKKEKDILIITHGAVIMLLLSLKEGYSYQDSFLRVRVENARADSFEDSEIEDIREKLGI